MCILTPMPSLRAAALTFVFVQFFSVTPAANDRLGNVIILSQASENASSVAVTYQPYPPKNGVRTTSPHDIDLQTRCSSCDRGAPTEFYYPDDGVCITLSDANVHAIHFQNGSLEADAHPLADGCTPRYLQNASTTELIVVCHDSCFQLISRSGSTLTPHDLTCGVGQGGIVVVASTHYGSNLFHVELEGNWVTSTDHSTGHFMDITPIDCSEPLSLHPIFTQNKLFLKCRTNDGNKNYILHPHMYDFGAASLFLDSVPLSSPDGRTFATVSNTTLKVYNIDNLAQYPGAKDFGVAITFITYLNSDTLIVMLDGYSQTLVHVFTFLNSAGEDGLTALPYTTSRSTLHKLITSEMYITYNQTGSVYNIQAFNISDRQPLEPVSNLMEEPLDAFFGPGTGLPPPVLQPSTLVLSATPSPSSISLSSPSTNELSSNFPRGTATAEPPVKSKETSPDESTDEKPTARNGTPAHHSQGHAIVGVPVALVAVAVLAAVVVVPLIVWKFKRRVKVHRPHEQVTEEGQSESSIKLHILSQPSLSSSCSGTTIPSAVNSSHQNTPSQLVTGTL